MPDRERFRALDGFAPPDRWATIESRADEEMIALDHGTEPRSRRALVTAVIAVALLGGGLAVAARHASGARAVRTAASTTTASVVPPATCRIEVDSMRVDEPGPGRTVGLGAGTGTIVLSPEIGEVGLQSNPGAGIVLAGRRGAQEVAVLQPGLDARQAMAAVTAPITAEKLTEARFAPQISAAANPEQKAALERLLASHELQFQPRRAQIASTIAAMRPLPRDPAATPPTIRLGDGTLSVWVAHDFVQITYAPPAPGGCTWSVNVGGSTSIADRALATAVAQHIGAVPAP